MVPKQQSSGNKPKNLQNNNNFLEILRDLGKGTGKSLQHDLVEEIPRDVLSQIGLRKNEEANTSKTLYGEKNKEEQLLLERRRLKRKLKLQEILHQEEKVVFSGRRQEIQEKVKILQEEAEKLAKASKNLDEKVKMVATQGLVEPGIYHVGFLEGLISFIKKMAQKVTNAGSWLSLITARSKKRSHYWNRVQKSGSKFMLSQERYMTTQAG